MRRFTPEYLRDTRRGLWENRSVLEGVFDHAPERILDVGAGTGAFTRVLSEESGATVYGLDADRVLLLAGSIENPIQGAATRLPFPDASVDIVACQALLVNLPDPEAAVMEFGRVASDRILLVEPDNGGVDIESTVDSEVELTGRARSYYLSGVATDPELGADLEKLLDGLDTEVVSVRQMIHERHVNPPYTAADVESARRKITAERLDDHRKTLQSGGLSTAEYDRFRDDWQAMGREVAEQIRVGTYRRRERVPFYVAVGRPKH